MASSDAIELEGTVVSMPGGGFYMVKTETGIEVQAKLAGKMRKYKIKVVVGDAVTVAVSPYDVTKGRIIYRKR
jgi:translation initiation factor IF-1